MEIETQKDAKKHRETSKEVGTLNKGQTVDEIGHSHVKRLRQVEDKRFGITKRIKITTCTYKIWIRTNRSLTNNLKKL